MAKRLTKDEWAQARVAWETNPDMSDQAIAELFGITKQAVMEKRKRDEWARVGAMQNINQRAQLSADKTCLNLAIGKVKSDTIDLAVEIRADVLDRHRADWAEHRNHFTVAGIAKDFELGKSAKITAEMLKIRQEGERKAFGLDEQQSTDNKTSLADAITSLIDKLPN